MIISSFHNTIFDNIKQYPCIKLYGTISPLFFVLIVSLTCTCICICRFNIFFPLNLINTEAGRSNHTIHQHFLNRVSQEDIFFVAKTIAAFSRTIVDSVSSRSVFKHQAYKPSVKLCCSTGDFQLN